MELFRIEQKIETNGGYINFLTLFIYIFKPIPKYTYWTSAVNKSFATKQEALDYIPKLTPKYHEI